MIKTRKLFSAILAFALIFNIFAISTVAETVNGEADFQLNVSLQIGRVDADTEVFTPLSPAEEIPKDDIITVRVILESDFCVGGQNIPVMFDKSKFEVMGGGAAAFTVNEGNTYYNLACLSHSGATNLPESAWPPSFAEGERYDVYKVIQANFMVTSGTEEDPIYPVELPGDWLFQFNLKTTQTIVSGTDARIFMDDRWFRTPESGDLKGYVANYDCGITIADQGNATYAYAREFKGADITLPTKAATITFVTGDGGTVIAPLIGEIGSPVVEPANPTRKNYVFKCWDDLPETFPADDPTVTAEWILKGDVNLSGKLQLVDALLALQAFSKEVPLVKGSDDFIAADIDGNGKIQLLDALNILKKFSREMPEWP